MGVGIVLIALAVAAGLGAFHALEPGHGKTVVAAYLVGSRGTAWHALLLGLTVTASHTAGVYLLGAVTLYASRYVVPERLYPWLGVISGLTVAGLGCVLFLRRYAGQAHPHAHTHSHAHGHSHQHAYDHEHPHHAHASDGERDHAPDGHGHHHHAPGEAVSLPALLALGVTGGIVPCPAALVVLLSAVSLQRVGFGLLLILAFSVGLAAVLIAIGLLMVYARRFMSRFQAEGPLITRWLPLTSSAVITLLGVAIAMQALQTAGILQIRL
jgi:ABC-type nickel/cobalt efflux system permease component RcnA